MYGPALERTGEICSGIDVWAKRTRKPVIERWYYLADYHKDHGEGLDFYKVGPSRGCGGTGIWRGNRLHVAKNFVTWSILENGPERVVFELGYAPYDAAGVAVRESRKIMLEAGSNLNRIETRFEWEGGPDELEARVGIVKHDGGGLQYAADGTWLACWEPEPGGGSFLGCGVVVPGGAQARTPGAGFPTRPSSAAKAWSITPGPAGARAGIFRTRIRPVLPRHGFATCRRPPAGLRNPSTSFELFVMQIRYSPSQTEYPTLSTEQLRASFLVESLFRPGQVELVYTDADRGILGSALPTDAPLKLTADAELRAAFFCERRELGF
jgi:hypothetical protein